MAETLGIGLGSAAAVLAAAGTAFELKYRQRPGNELDLTTGTWKQEILSPDRHQLIGELEAINRTKNLEIMVPEVNVDVTLLSDRSLEEVTWRTKIVPMHPDAPAREDGYWFAYIVKIGKTTRFKVAIEICGPHLEGLKSALVKITYVTYGPQGRIPKDRYVVVPLQYPDQAAETSWREVPDAEAEILPIKTHLLSNLDNATGVVKRYVMPHAQPGDVVTIGETPLAIMQDQWRHPSEVRPGFVAKRLCYFFMPTASLATACGLQTLVDLVGPLRVVLAFMGGAIGKILGKGGGFYQLAGEQARLIDDVTGTLPPYDRFIVLGPDNPQQVVDTIKKETGLSAAIVDVNDLKAVKILAATPDLSTAFLEKALRSNPAGNADEQTPVVLIRPRNPSQS
ncbi:F420-0:Gamma-glutamyl ligase [Phormidium sp. CCY1219]|uniref:F420-0:Gamma-glutamyl ligase n=1 Tax=Phormidium sp. CCY1219 TaxID=2886104 RepID=UPI002D1F7E4D|nr:F420-0:Gamma-glutamyl ligase [Phormidium sp. CCY1219]MEB3826272.1 F420-0:Gamma-glutamyl ligase [Phormidium sp. CCY1219]